MSTLHCSPTGKFAPALQSKRMDDLKGAAEHQSPGEHQSWWHWGEKRKQDCSHAAANEYNAEGQEPSPSTVNGICHFACSIHGPIFRHQCKQRDQPCRARQARWPRAAPSLMSWIPSSTPSSHSAVTGVFTQSRTESRRARSPLAKTQPQFGKGRMVREKMIFEKPSTMNSIMRRSVRERRPASGLRRKSTPTTTNSTAYIT